MRVDGGKRPAGKQDWFGYDQFYWQRASRTGTESTLSQSNTFIQAAIYNLHNLNHKEYWNVTDRHDFYDLISYAIEFDRNSPKKIRSVKFFHATTIVTGKPGVGNIETAPAQMLFEVNTRKIMVEINEILFIANMKVMKSLKYIWREPRSPFKESLQMSSFDFDTHMVFFEQLTVENHIKKRKSLITPEVIEDFSFFLDPDGVAQFLNPSKKPIQWATEAMGHTLDFLRIKDRIAIGLALIHMLHKKKKTDYETFLKTVDQRLNRVKGIL